MSPVLPEESPVNPIVPERAPWRGLHVDQARLGCAGGNGRGQESWGCQATLPVYWEDKSHNNGKKGSFPCLLFVSLFLRDSARSDPLCSPRVKRDLFMLQRTKRFILGDENRDFWICWGRGLAETGTPGFGRKRDGGKSQFLISGHIPLMYHLLLANICVFALSLSPRKRFAVPAPNGG